MTKYVPLTLSFILGMAVGMSLMWYSTPRHENSTDAAARPPLFYRHPMGAADTSPIPRKDEMGMDYVPVYADEVSEDHLFTISPEKIQRLGVKAEKLEIRKFVNRLLVPGSIQVDERRTYAISSKYEGWVQRLYVNATGMAVKRGQSLLEAYSPELLAAGQKYLHARRHSDDSKKHQSHGGPEADQATADALQYLRFLDFPAEQLQQLQSANAVPSSEAPLLSPVDGVVLEKKAVEGMRFWRGDVLFRIAELSKIWFVADVFEQDLSWLRQGQSVQVHVNAYPGKEFRGRIDFISPTVEPETRTVRINIEMPNDAGLLKLGMFGSAELTAVSPNDSVALPDSAVIDSGTRRVVLVRKGDTAFEPRQVKLGRRVGEYFEVQEGVEAGEAVVTHANFLIDAESNLKAALVGMGGDGDAKHRKPSPRPDPTTPENSAGRP